MNGVLIFINEFCPAGLKLVLNYNIQYSTAGTAE